MRRSALLVLAALLFVLPHAARAQESRSRGEEKADLAGFWPSDKMVDLVLVRWAEEAADDNGLDDEQVDMLKERMLKRWPAFLKENREKIQPVLNEFIEMRLEMEPPSKERVQAWAERAQPVLDGFREQINYGIEEFRETLNPLQKAKFEANVLEFSAGLQVADAKLKQWKRGEFEEREFWDPPPAERRRRRAEREATERGEAPAAPKPKDQIADELDRWEKYVAQVIETFQLDDAQKASAQSMLKDQKERAAAYRDRNIEEIARLEARITAIQARNAKKEDTKAELAEVKAQLTEVYGPIDEMFEELKRRVDSLPTREQRERMEKGLIAEEQMKEREARRRERAEEDTRRRVEEARAAAEEAKARAAEPEVEPEPEDE